MELHCLGLEIDYLHDEIEGFLQLLGDERFRDISGAKG